MIKPATLGIFVFFLVFFSCKTDLKEIKKLSQIDTLPQMYAKNMVLKQSENGITTLELSAPVVKSYQTEDPYTIFPAGVRVTFFDSLLRPKLEITANQGIKYERKQLMEAKGNVIVHDYKQHRTLNTEKLSWDEKSRHIFTDEFVKYTTPTAIITGTGLNADDIFSEWEIKNVSGVLKANDNH